MINTLEISAPGNSVVSFSVPAKDHKYFASTLPFEVQEEIRILLRALAQIHRADNVTAACKRLATTFSEHRRGFSAWSLRRKYYEYAGGTEKYAAGDWRILWNKSKAPVRNQGLPHAFLEFWRQLCEENQRCCAEAHRELIQIWKTRFGTMRLGGKCRELTAIPGYQEWPKAEAFTDLPAGWAYGNLMRFTPDRWSLAAGRVGASAASEHRLKVRTSRVGLRLGEFIQFDDHEYNLKINFPGQRKAMRPRGFVAIDVLSACLFAKSFKPTLWDELNQKKRALTETDMMWFVVHVLTQYGFRTDERGSTFVVEWGTAAIKDAFETRIESATGGCVKIARGGKFGKPLHAGEFRGASKGNFRFKGLVESHFNLIDNYFAGLPGQTGKDRNHSPEQLYGLENYNEKLLKASELLSDDQSARLQFPVLTWPQFQNAALDIYRKINASEQHELEGWEKLGFVSQEWRLTQDHPWLPAQQLLELPEAAQAVASAMIKSNSALSKVRKLSRGEVFSAFQNELTRLAAHQLPTLIGLERGVLRPVKNGEFEFDDEDISPDPLRYRAINGPQRLDGQYLTFVNPFAPEDLIVTDDKGKFICACPEIPMPCRNDVKAIEEQMGEARRWESAAARELAARHVGSARELLDLHNNNAEAMSPGSAKDRRIAREISDQAAAEKDDFRALDSAPKNEPPETGYAASMDDLRALQGE